MVDQAADVITKRRVSSGEGASRSDERAGMENAFMPSVDEIVALRFGPDRIGGTIPE